MKRLLLLAGLLIAGPSGSAVGQDIPGFLEMTERERIIYAAAWFDGRAWALSGVFENEKYGADVKACFTHRIRLLGVHGFFKDLVDRHVGYLRAEPVSDPVWSNTQFFITVLRTCRVP